MSATRATTGAARSPAFDWVAHGYHADWVAAHEAGHAVTSWALRIPFAHVAISAEPGRSCLQPAPLGPVPAALEDELKRACCLVRASGTIAEQQHRAIALGARQIVKLLQGRDDEVICYSDMRTGLVAETGRRAPAVAPGADFHFIARAAARMTPAACVALWRDCERYVSACMPAVSAVAAVLLNGRKLSYAEVADISERAMSGHPAPIPPWAAR